MTQETVNMNAKIVEPIREYGVIVGVTVEKSILWPHPSPELAGECR